LDRLLPPYNTENLPPPEVIAQEIVDDLEAALAEFAAVAASLRNPEQTA
jgi:type I restriction enzyme M protein